MDYLELDDSALQAFEELNDDAGTISSQRSRSTSVPVRSRPHRRVEAEYLVRLEEPFQTPRELANALGLSRVPPVEKGCTEHGKEADFCYLSESTINAFESWTAEHFPSRQFLKFRIGVAHKDVGSLPLLGRDITLPQHRPYDTASHIEPALEYPVRYFFYGTLADPAQLERLFGVPSAELPPLESAILLDGRVRIWGAYRAVVDEPGAKVDGYAFRVTSSDQEDALRAYESDNYEVVAARIIVDGQEQIGRTFRFAGFENELTG